MKLPDYITSDTHFTDPIIATHFRRYTPTHPSLEDIDDSLVENWNGVVGASYRTILHLGDLMFGPRRKQAEEHVRKLVGKKILVKGNHDLQDDAYYEDLGFEVVEPFSITRNDIRILFSHYPLKGLKDTDINFHGHIHSAHCDFITAAHVNVGSDVRLLCPQKTVHLFDATHYRLRYIGESRDRDKAAESRFGLDS